MTGQRRILWKAFVGIVAANRPDATPEWECKPPRAQESVILLASGISQNATINKQTHQERETGQCARVIRALPSKATLPTSSSPTGHRGGREYWRRRLSNPTSTVAHAPREGFPNRPHSTRFHRPTRRFPPQFPLL